MHTKVSNCVMALLVVILSLVSGACATSTKSFVRESVEAVSRDVKPQKETTDQAIERLSVVPPLELFEDQLFRERALLLYKEKREKELESAKRRAKGVSRVEAQAVDQILDEKKEDKERVKDLAEAKIKSSLRCPRPEEADLVWVNPDAVRGSRHDVHSVMLIQNGDDLVNIIQTQGGKLKETLLGEIIPDPDSFTMVRNMCRGGSIRLYTPIGWERYGRTVSYRAVEAEISNQNRRADSPSVHMTACQSFGCQKEFQKDWNIRLR